MEAWVKASREGPEDRRANSNSGGVYLQKPLWQTRSNTEAGTLLSLLLSKLALGP